MKRTFVYDIYNPTLRIQEDAEEFLGLRVEPVYKAFGNLRDILQAGQMLIEENETSNFEFDEKSFTIFSECERFKFILTPENSLLFRNEQDRIEYFDTLERDLKRALHNYEVLSGNPRYVVFLTWTSMMLIKAKEKYFEEGRLINE